MRSIDRSHHWRKSFSLHLSDVSMLSFSLTRGRFLGSSGAMVAVGLTVRLLPRLFERELERAFFLFFFFLFFLSSDELEVDEEEALRFLLFFLFFLLREELDELLDDDDELEGDESESPGSLYLTFRLRFRLAVLIISPDSEDSSSVCSFFVFFAFFFAFFFYSFCSCYQNCFRLRLHLHMGLHLPGHDHR
jgi:hypothetical protein